MTTTTFTSHRGTANPENAQRFHEAYSRLRDAGWLELGMGAYSAVLQHPDCPETVLKIGKFSYSTPETDGWLNYVRANAKTRSPHAPKVYAVEIYNDYFYAEMEPLGGRLGHDEFERLGLEYFRYTSDASAIPAGSLKAFVRRTERLRRAAYERGTKLCPDSHRGNYLYRPSTGEVVLSDPWSN